MMGHLHQSQLGYLLKMQIPSPLPKLDESKSSKEDFIYFHFLLVFQMTLIHSKV